MKKVAALLLCGLLAACGGGVMTGDKLIDDAAKNSIDASNKIKAGVTIELNPSRISEMQDGTENIGLMYVKKDAPQPSAIFAQVNMSKSEAAQIKGSVILKCSGGEIESAMGVGITLTNCTLVK